MAATRRRLKAGRSGMQSDAMWTAESRDEDGKPVRDPGSITYSAAIESAASVDTSPKRSEFAERVLRETTRRGFTDASLDRFHAKEHLSRVGKVIYRDSEQGKKRIQRRYDELDQVS